MKIRFIRFAIRLTLGISLIFIINACSSDFSIQSVSNFKAIDFSSIKSPNTLVIFDVDETLIQPVDTYLINEHKAEGINFREKMVADHPGVKDWDKILSIILEEAKRPLIEPDIVSEIKKLQERNVLVIACTGMNTGKAALYERLEIWRYDHLKSLGFEGSFTSKDFTLQGFKSQPVFYKGVLSADLEEKGPVIGAFLDKISFKPEKIVMIDDDGAYIRSVKEECFKRGINFEGYLYQGAKEKKWDEDLIKFQLQHLLTHYHWLSDDVAKQLMQEAPKSESRIAG
ncbi:MAG: DUF2608 domain-containing protein [Alphaproteobacteria bacterium]|nr:DUF2608 domain-containing protein [Alphaproteobacteria bacterium]